MDRICEKQISTDAKGKWLGIIPKVIKVAESEDNSTIQCLLEKTDSEDRSHGKFIFIHYGACNYSCMCFSDIRSIVATAVTFYLLPDTRTKSDLSKIMLFVPVSIGSP